MLPVDGCLLVLENEAVAVFFPESGIAPESGGAGHRLGTVHCFGIGRRLRIGRCFRGWRSL